MLFYQSMVLKLFRGSRNRSIYPHISFLMLCNVFMSWSRTTVLLKISIKILALLDLDLVALLHSYGFKVLLKPECTKTLTLVWNLGAVFVRFRSAKLDLQHSGIDKIFETHTNDPCEEYHKSCLGIILFNDCGCFLWKMCQSWAVQNCGASMISTQTDRLRLSSRYCASCW